MSNGNGHHWSKFSWRDWSGDAGLRDCSLATKGFWIGILGLMHEGTPVGHLTVNGLPATLRQMASHVNCTVKEAEKALAELEAARVFSRADDGTIYSRRMVKDAAAADAARTWGKTGGNPNLKGKANGASTDHKPERGVNPPVNDPPNPPPLTPPITGRVNGGVPLELDTDSELEEKKESKSKYLTLPSSPGTARVVEACNAPPDGTYGSEPQPEPPSVALQLGVKTVVEKLGRRFDANKSGSVLAQGKPPKLTRIEQQDYVLHGEVMEPGPRRGPQAPQRTVAEQLAALGFPQHAMAASP